MAKLDHPNIVRMIGNHYILLNNFSFFYFILIGNHYFLSIGFSFLCQLFSVSSCLLSILLACHLVHISFSFFHL